MSDQLNTSVADATQCAALCMDRPAPDSEDEGLEPCPQKGPLTGSTGEAPEQATAGFDVLGGPPGARAVRYTPPEAAGAEPLCVKCKSRPYIQQNLLCCGTCRPPLTSCRKCKTAPIVPFNLSCCRGCRVPRPPPTPSEKQFESRLDMYRASYADYERVNIMKQLVRAYGYKRYLEIGTDAGQTFSRMLAPELGLDLLHC